MRVALSLGLLVAAVGCTPRYDLRANALEVGDVLVDVGTFELHAATLEQDGTAIPVDARFEGRVRNEITRMDGDEVIEAEERTEAMTLTLRVAGVHALTERSPLEGMHMRAFRHQGVWERSLASGRLKVHQGFLLEMVAHPLGLELLPRAPLEVGESVPLSSMDIAGLFGMPLYAEVEGSGRLTLERVEDGVAYLGILTTTRIRHSGLGWFVYQLRGKVEAALGDGYARRYDMAGHIEIPLKHLGERGRLKGPARFEGGFTPAP